MTNTISQKITAAVLKGRSILPRRQPDKAAPLTPERAKASLTKFAELLTRLEAAREELDRVQQIADQSSSKSEDLAEIFLRTGGVPSPGALEDQAAGGKLLTAVIKSVLDTLAADASRSIARLQELKMGKISLLEEEMKNLIERPAWMRPEDFTIAVAGSPVLEHF